MSRRLTTEELDLQFEQFLKESVSDDSVELGSKHPSVLDSLGKPPPPRAERQRAPPARPWWQDDDDDGFEKPVKRRFLKGKKPSVEENQPNEIPEEAVTKPIPRPRTRASPRPSQPVATPSPPPESSQADTDRPEAPAPSSQPASSVASHYDSQNASAPDSPQPSGHRSQTASAVSSPVPSENSSHSAPRRRGRQTSHDSSDRMPGTTTSSHRRDASGNASGLEATITDSSHDAPVESSSSEGSDGLLGSSRTFRKSLRKSQPIQEEDEEKPQRRASEDGEEQRGADFLSRDSLEPDESMMASGPLGVASRSGLDTLEEEEEEERRRFFARLEGGANSTIDYSWLNREMESTGSTLTTLLRKTEVPGDLKEEKNKPRVPEKLSPGGSADYSEDFDEDEASEREKGHQEQSPESPGMLAKVSLHDSLNSTDGGLAPAEAPGSHGEEEEEEGRKEEDEAHAAETPAVAHASGQSYGLSGASEVEALQEAYRQLSRSAEESEVREQRSSLAAGEVTSRPLSPVVLFTSTLKPVSTTESDLPTAEELMRPIGPDSSFTRGFSLHPVSEVEQKSEVRESQEKSPARGGPEEEEQEEKEERPVSAASRHRSIAEEVRRLMEEQEEKTPRQPPGNKAKARKRQPAWRPTIFAPTSSSSHKAQVPPAKPSSAESRPAQSAASTSGTVRTRETAKPPSPVVRRKRQGQDQDQDQPPSRIPTLGQTQTVKVADSEPSLRLSSELVASVQSFAAFLQQQVEASSSISSSIPPKSLDMETAHTRTPALSKPPEEDADGDGGRAGAGGLEAPPLVPPPADRSALEHLRLQLAQRERALDLREQQLREEHSRQISTLKQENYLLHSKLRQVEDEGQKGVQSPGQASDLVSEEKLRHLEKEVREQETLLQGYHQENEKLYLQVKALQAQNKRNEEAMFTENQRLLHELAITKDKMNRNSVQRTVGVVGTCEQGYNVADLLAQVKGLERAEARLQEEARRLRQDKQALQLDLDMMKKERDLAKIQTLHTSGDLGFELKMQEQRHQEEVTALKKRLQWYAENQELLDRDAGRLRAATSEVKNLTEQVERLRSQVDNRASQQQRRMKERAADAKRIQDLERQVKEMEEILRRRHPNSLPALMYAAAAAPLPASGADEDQEEGGGGVAKRAEKPDGSPNAPPQSAALLERRVHRLEAELENRDEDAKRSLRAMEQQFVKVKLQYEQRIDVLQRQLSETCQTPRKTGGEGEEEASVHSLQEEVRKLKEAQQERESSLQAEVASLQEQLQKLQGAQQQRSPGAYTQRHQRQAEEAQSARVERLTSELAAKSRSLQELTRTLERLQRERRTMLSGHWAGTGAGVKGHEVKVKSSAGVAAAAVTKATMTTESFPATQDEKAYQPAAFAGSHISEVLAESDGLRERLEKLEQESQQEREALQAAATHAQTELQRVKEHSAQQLASLSVDHKRELEILRGRHALEHSTSKVAELTNQVSSHEIMVRHLRDQLKELQGTKEALTVSKLREDTLQHQLTRLLEELKQAKEAHSPELRHFTSLERKIHNMELRYSEREKELQQVIAETRVATQAELQGELERWKRLAQSRSRELDAFRLELDAILDVLRELQRQGVVIPAPEHTTRIPWGR